jgi:aryl-alcohol dehydrogenase-like predicted oxidoreductase
MSDHRLMNSMSSPLALTDYRTLGRSGLRVSAYCLVAWTFGEDAGFGSSVETSEQIIETYLQPGRREGVVITTKFFGNLFPGNPTGAKGLLT